MTNSASSFMAISFGLAVFAVIVAVGWRSVQNRRILRLQGANGQEMIIVAGEADDISSVTTAETTHPAPAPAPAPSVVVVNAGVVDPAPAPSRTNKSESVVDDQVGIVGADRLGRVISSAK
jgi:hypothetical protein